MEFYTIIQEDLLGFFKLKPLQQFRPFLHFRLQQFDWAEEGGHEKIKKISGWRLQHGMHPPGARKEIVDALIADNLKLSIALFGNYLDQLLEDLEAGIVHPAYFAADSQAYD